MSESEKSESVDVEIVVLTVDTQTSVVAGLSERDWLIDSAASRSITNNSSLLTNPRPAVGTKVKLPDGRLFNASLVGDVVITVVTGDVEHKYTLHDVLVVDEIKCNLLSATRAAEQSNLGFTLVNKTCTVFDGQSTQVLACIPQVNGLLKWQLGLRIGGSAKSQSKSVALINHTEDINVLHDRFAHQPHDKIAAAVKKGLVAGVTDVTGSKPKYCEVCAVAKTGSASHSAPLERGTYPFEVVHSDMCGPIRTRGRHGDTYVLSFICTYSGYVVTYLMQHKTELQDKFTHFIDIVATIVSDPKWTVRHLHSDNGSEYKSRLFRKFCLGKKIRQSFTAPESPEQNGIAERWFQTSWNGARAMREHAQTSSFVLG